MNLQQKIFAHISIYAQVQNFLIVYFLTALCTEDNKSICIQRCIYQASLSNSIFFLQKS